MSKSDLKARPIYHHKLDSIKAHLTIVFTALAMARFIETRTHLSIKKFVRTLKVIQACIVTIGSQQYQTQPNIDPDVKKLVDNLLRGY
jgi:transposase